MTEEEKKAADLAAAEEAKAKAEPEPRGEGEAIENINVDHEAELKRERERAEAAEKAAADEAYKRRELQRKIRESPEEDELDEDKPLTAKELKVFLAQERQETQKVIQSELITEKAKKLAGSDAEAQLIVEIHKNRSFPSYLSLDEQLEEAQAIANKGKLKAQNEELKRSLRSKETASDNVAGTHRESPTAGEPRTSADIIAIKAAGFLWDGKLNVWKKESGKKIVMLDRNLKNRRVIEK